MGELRGSCQRCGRELYVRSNYIDKYDSNVYCQDCRIHTECNNCGRGLRLRPSRYQRLGGDPLICEYCNQNHQGRECRKSREQQQSQQIKVENKDPIFWAGLRGWERVVFILLVILFLSYPLGYLQFGTDALRAGFPLILAHLYITHKLHKKGKENAPSIKK